MQVLLFLSGTALPPASQNLPGMHLMATNARQVTINIQRDGMPVVNATLSPTYNMSYPNGRECDINPCITASATVPTQ